MTFRVAKASKTSEIRGKWLTLLTEPAQPETDVSRNPWVAGLREIHFAHPSFHSSRPAWISMGGRCSSPMPSVGGALGLIRKESADCLNDDTQETVAVELSAVVAKCREPVRLLFGRDHEWQLPGKSASPPVDERSRARTYSSGERR